MNLQHYTSRSLNCIAASDSFDRAISLMEEHGFHHLPVVKDGRVVGMLSDRDILLAVGWRLEVERLTDGRHTEVVGPRQVAEVMSIPAICLAPDDDIATAARMMADRQFHAIVIARDHRPLGIVTSFDVLKHHSGPPSPVTPAQLLEQVDTCMRLGVAIVGPKTPLSTAARLMRDMGIRHLPVVSEDVLIGLLTDRDLRRETGEEMVKDSQAEESGEFYIGATTVMEVMSHSVETAREKDTLLYCLNRMVERRIGCLPIERSGRLVGIVTDTDLLRLIARIESPVC